MATEPLITFDHAKSHLRINHNDEDFDIEMKMRQATGIVLRRIKDPGGSPGTWTVDTVPDNIEAAILKMLKYLMRWRGDDEMSAAAQARMALGYLPADVESLLSSYIDPTLA